MSDEVFGALVLVTNLRMAGQSLDGLPRAVVDHLIGLLGRDQLASLLAIDDAELMIRENAVNGHSHLPFPSGQDHP